MRFEKVSMLAFLLMLSSGVALAQSTGANGSGSASGGQPNGKSNSSSKVSSSGSSGTSASSGASDAETKRRGKGSDTDYPAVEYDFYPSFRVRIIWGPAQGG